LRRCRLKVKANEFSTFVKSHLQYLQKKHNKEASVFFDFGRIATENLDIRDGESLPIHGILAYAGVSLNNRLYLPEHLATGHERQLPLRINHSSVLGLQQEIHRLPREVQEALMRGEDVEVGEVNLTWHPESLTLTYEGFVANEFFKNEIHEGRMSVSLGVLYDADAPEVCDVECYTIIKGAEFEEVSLVYHKGFPVATLVATELFLKKYASLNTFKQQVSNEKQDTMRKKKSKEDMDEGIGGIDNPADMPVDEAGGSNCPEGQVMNAETGQCEEIDTTDTSKSITDTGAPEKVVADGPPESTGEGRSKRGKEQDDDDDDKKNNNKMNKKNNNNKDADEQDAPDEDEDKNKEKKMDKTEELIAKIARKIGVESAPGPWKPNADIKSERRRTEEYLKTLERKEALQEIANKEKVLHAKEVYAKELELEGRIKRAKESARGKFVVTQEKQSQATEMAIIRPAQWFTAVKEHRNPPAAWEWTINKQSIFENYDGRHVKYWDERGLEHLMPMTPNQKKGTEAITGPPVADFMRIMSEQVLVLPEGKIVTPIRQFTEVKVLPPGTREAFFFDYGKVDFADITEGTPISDSTTVTRSAGGATSPRGARVNINYSDIEESPIDLVAANNRSFALESVNDESVEMLGDRTYNDDTGSSGDATTRKAKGGGTKDGRWINGNDASDLTTASNDSTLTSTALLTFKGLLAGKLNIEEEGLDVSNLVMYTSPKAVNDVIQDPELDSYIGFSRPDIITEGVVERIAGVNLVKSSAIAVLASGGVATGRRSVMFIPQVAFGLVTGRDLTMEAQRRNELQTIFLTGTQKIAGFTKNVEGTVRLSHA